MIEIKNITIQFPNFALINVCLTINNGDFFILLGPTGSGKTLMIESIAGIVPVNDGRIFINGQDVTNKPPEKRNVGIVYQDYALFPHMTVMENVRYGLSYQKKQNADDKRIKDLMEKTGIFKLKDRSVKHLSGGEKQRVALVRALAVKPSILLLDEPLSSLDPCFRDDIQKLLKMLHQNTKTTFLMVTHDFAEALYLGDQAAVLNCGRIEQCGPVNDIFKYPKNAFVEYFIGKRKHAGSQ